MYSNKIGKRREDSGCLAISLICYTSSCFLCDRETTNVPKSQVGFIGGFIIPTYNFLVIMFPTLSYTVENAKNKEDFGSVCKIFINSLVQECSRIYENLPIFMHNEIIENVLFTGFLQE